MRFTSPILIFVLLTSFTFVGSKPKEIIVRKWKIDVEESKSNYEKIFKEGDDEQANKFARGMVEWMFETLKNSTIEYKEEGELITTINKIQDDGSVTPRIIKGNWKISKNGKELTTTENNQKTEVKVLSLTEQRMEQAMSLGKGEDWVIVFVPVQ